MTFVVPVLTGALLVGAGGLIAIPRRTFTAGLAAQAAGCVFLAAGGLWALATDGQAGSAFTSAFDPRIGVDGLSGLFLGVLGGGRRGGTRVRHPVPGAVGARPGDRRAGRAVRSGAGARPGGARPAHVPPRLGGDDTRARRGDPRRPCRRGRAARGLLLRRTHASGRCGNVGGRPPPRTGGSDRRPDRRLLGVGPAGRDRARRARRHGREGGPDAAPRLAAARTPDRTGARVRADERRDDQDRRLRAGARARRVARRPAGVARGARAGRRGAVGRRRGGVRALPARAETAARIPLDREHGDHRARSRGMPRAASARDGRLGRVRARRPRCSTP